jgi:hypothetical protein
MRSTSLDTDLRCVEQKRLMDNLSRAIHALVKAQLPYTTKLKTGEARDFDFDEDLILAAAEWGIARKAYLQHFVEHRCWKSEVSALDLRARVEKRNAERGDSNGIQLLEF